MVKRTWNNLSLCSGGAGLDLGLELLLGDFRTVCWVEWEAFAIEFLASRMEAECLPQAPLYTDVRTFDGKPWRGIVDSITAGYPCQPFSLAGKRLGEDDPRHLWPHVARIISEVEPRVVFLENVSGHLSLGYEQVEADLQGLGYKVTPGLFTASEIGASQKRERLFILAMAGGSSTRLPWWKNAGASSSNEEENTSRCEESKRSIGILHGGSPVVNNSSQRWRQGRAESEVRCGRNATTVTGCQLFPPRPIKDDWIGIPTHLWPATKSGICELVDGLAKDRTRWLKLLGNGVVPLQAAYAFATLIAVSKYGEDG